MYQLKYEASYTIPLFSRTRKSLTGWNPCWLCAGGGISRICPCASCASVIISPYSFAPAYLKDLSNPLLNAKKQYHDIIVLFCVSLFIFLFLVTKKQISVKYHILNMLKNGKITKQMNKQKIVCIQRDPLSYFHTRPSQFCLFPGSNFFLVRRVF